MTAAATAAVTVVSVDVAAVADAVADAVVEIVDVISNMIYFWSSNVVDVSVAPPVRPVETSPHRSQS